MKNLSIVFHSGYGHTKKLAESVLDGVNMIETINSEFIEINQSGDISKQNWDDLAQSDCIIFGSPTYMGNVSWQFKKFADESSKPWSEQMWRNKLAAGFTNSAAMNGDKLSTLNYMFTLSMQHAMLWAGTGMMPANTKASGRNDLNYLGAFSGLMSQSPADASIDEGPLPGDLTTAVAFGQRIAEIVKSVT